MDIEQIFESKGEMTRKQRQLADYITNYSAKDRKSVV